MLWSPLNWITVTCSTCNSLWRWPGRFNLSWMQKQGCHSRVIPFLKSQHWQLTNIQDQFKVPNDLTEKRFCSLGVGKKNPPYFYSSTWKRHKRKTERKRGGKKSYRKVSFGQWVFCSQELASKEARVWGKRNKNLNHLNIQKWKGWVWQVFGAGCLCETFQWCPSPQEQSTPGYSDHPLSNAFFKIWLLGEACRDTWRTSYPNSVTSDLVILLCYVTLYYVML